ncbi:hypothetical protein ACH4OW_34660 [Streptomyces sp. NPDC017056]|uniref:LppU/SCO3897 family protein n=1 Tax=Streptomyces sp. NPDC017056 TaxID=3364973 RepID=UPI00378A2AB8
MTTPPPPQNGGYPPYGQPGQPPYGQPPAPHGQPAYGQNPYGQNPYGQAPHPQAPYGGPGMAQQGGYPAGPLPTGPAPTGPNPGQRPPRRVRVPGIVRALVVLLIFGGVAAWVVLHQDEYNAESRKKPKVDPHSVTNAKVGDCLHKTGGTDDEPELEILGCGESGAQFKVVKMRPQDGCEPGQGLYRMRNTRSHFEVVSFCMTRLNGASTTP